jgi:organic radical activating enzyme
MMKIRFYTGRQCNFDCIHCFDTEVPKIKFKRYEIDLDKYIRFVESFNQPVTVGFVGGEPMLSKNIVEFVSWLTNNGHFATLTTNMTMKIEELVNTCDMSKISVYGSVHFRQIEHKNLQQVFIRNYHLLNKYRGIMRDFDVAEIAEPSYTKEEVEYYTDFYRNKNDVHFHFATYLDIYNNLEPYKYTDEQLNYFGIQEDITLVETRAVYPSCGAGLDYIIVDAGGDIYPCEGIAWHNGDLRNTYYLGNINTTYKPLNETAKCKKGHCTCPTTL